MYAPDAAPAVQAVAEELPFDDASFDAAMAILTLHQWSDVNAGLLEMLRVARQRVVLVGFDLEVSNELWTVRDYLPELMTANAQVFPSMKQLHDVLPTAAVQTLMVPRDRTDRMFATLWARPEQHLDPAVRAATSAWHQVPEAASTRALERLRTDLASGEWDERYGHLRTTPEWDVGLHLVRVELSE